MEFFETIMGHKFYEGTMPTIARALEALAEQQTKIVEYKTVSFDHEDDKDSLTKQVNKHLAEGWELYGSPIVMGYNMASGSSSSWLVQPMVRRQR